MSTLTEYPDYIAAILDQYSPGTVVEVTISRIIYPSQVITTFDNIFIGRLSLMDISYAMPNAEAMFSSYRVGIRIKCVIIGIDVENKVVKLSQKEVIKSEETQAKWIRISSDEELSVKLVQELNQYHLVLTNNGFYGIIPRDFDKERIANGLFLIKEKIEENRLLSLIPADGEGNIENDNIREQSAYRSIDEEFHSYRAFTTSLLFKYTEKEENETIREGFNIDPLIFSKEICLDQPLYLEFESNDRVYRNSLKDNAFSYFFPGQTFNPEDEKKLLEKLGTLKYWFWLNSSQVNPADTKKDSGNDLTINLFNEDIGIYVAIIQSGIRDARFVIKGLNIGHDWAQTTERKKWQSKNGAFLFSSRIILLGPYMSTPVGVLQQSTLDYLLLKSQCLEIAQRIKKESGEILRQEGHTLGIIDRFLEYQLSLLEAEKGEGYFIRKFNRVPSNSDGVTVSFTADEEIELENNSMVNVWIKRHSLKEDQETEDSWVGDAKFSYAGDLCQVTFSKDLEVKSLDSGFYLDKKLSKSNLVIQRDIIKDFLERKIKLDHIESLLVKPDRIKEPRISKVDFINPDLKKADTQNSDNNQINAVKKAVGNHNIFLIQGPPGTGKTTVIAEIIEQLVQRGQKVLVAGQNHVAVDNVLEKMSRNPNLSLLRAGRAERVAPELVRYCMEYQIEDYKNDFKNFIHNQSVLCGFLITLKSLSISHNEMLDRYQVEVDNVCKDYGKLKDWYRSKHFNLRDSMMALPASDVEKAMRVLNSWSQNIQTEYEVLLKPFIYNTVDVVFATCIGIRTDNMFKERKKKFDTVIIDEAGKASIAETLVAMELGKKVILVGDQMQLPPYMDSSLIDDKNPDSFQYSQFGKLYNREEVLQALKTSFFEFIIRRIGENKFPKKNLELLNYQHRMHPNIGEFVSSSFYDGKVRMGGKTHLNRLDLPVPFDKEIIFIDTSNANNAYEKADGVSVKNDFEANSIAEYILPLLYGNHVSSNDIAIIAPYKSQVVNINAHIRKSPKCPLKQIDVSTLDSFQGKEYDIIIFSFTRSANHNRPAIVDGRKKYIKVGFLDDARRLNVAFSRARKKLILIGNAKFLTDARSHYDFGLFNYTDLFKKLIQLSKNEKIGSFVNIADQGRTGSKIAQRLQVDTIVSGIVDSPAVARGTGVEYGKNIRVSSNRILAPYRRDENIINRNIRSYQNGDHVFGVVLKEPGSNYLFLKILESNWLEVAKMKQSGEAQEAVVIESNWTGIKVLTKTKLVGMVTITDFPKGSRPEKRSKLLVKIENFDYISQTIEFKLTK